MNRASYGSLAGLLVWAVLLFTLAAGAGLAADTSGEEEAAPAPEVESTAVPADQGALPAEEDEPRWQVQFGEFLPAFSTKLRVDASTALGDLGTEIDFEDDLKLSDRQQIYRLDVVWRHTRKSSFGLTYYTFDRTASLLLERDIEFGDTTFPAGSGVVANTDTSLLIVKYIRLLKETSRSELSWEFGIDRVHTAASLRTTGGTVLAEAASLSAPLPVVGLSGTYRISPQWRAGGEITGLALNIGDYSGSWLNTGATIEYLPREDLAIGLGLAMFKVRLDAETDNLLGRYEYRQTGPRIFATGSF